MQLRPDGFYRVLPNKGSWILAEHRYEKGKSPWIVNGQRVPTTVLAAIGDMVQETDGQAPESLKPKQDGTDTTLSKED